MPRAGRNNEPEAAPGIEQDQKCDEGRLLEKFSDVDVLSDVDLPAGKVVFAAIGRGRRGEPAPTSPGRAVLRNLRRRGLPRIDRSGQSALPEIEGISAVKPSQELPDDARSHRDRGAGAGRTRPSSPRRANEGLRPRSSSRPGSAMAPARSPRPASKSARATGLRLVGPNCLGVLAPRARLNASFAARMPRAGDLALISQSGAIAAGLVEWSAARGIGFSAVVSLGDQIDVDFGDLLDFFALDRGTRAILLYVESISDARKFMSAARAAARIKPVVVVKSGRHAQGAKAAQTHTGALAGADAVYDAAFRRAGLLRVLDLDELFAAAETLGRVQPFPGKRLADADQWRRHRRAGGRSARRSRRRRSPGISPQTCSKLDAALPPIWSQCQSGRHRGRCRCRALRRRVRGAAGGSGERRRPGHERADRARVGRRRPQDRSSRSRRRIAADRSGRSRSSRSGSASSAACDAASSRQPAFPIMRPNPTRCAASCTSCTIGRRSKHLMATPPSLPRGFHAGRRRRPRSRRRRACRADARWLDPIEVTALLRGLCHSDRARAAGARCRRSGGRRGAVPGGGRDRGRRRFCRPTSCTSPRSAACGSTSPANGAVRDAVADILARAQGGKARRPHRRRHHPSHGRCGPRRAS